MIQSILGKILLSPFSLLYGIGVGIRNVFYDSGIVRSSKFSVPIIAVGNLAVGGAGKTPHVEYLIRLLSPYINVGTLSRGYKRHTKGFRIIKSQDNAKIAGDEPIMYKRKYPDVAVVVGENRALAIPEMVSNFPTIQTIILDDAYQHRSVEPGLNILLTTHGLPFTRDYLLPSGRLREWRRNYNRADVIIVSKCPQDMTIADKEAIVKEIKPYDHQEIFFSTYTYGNPYYMFQVGQRIVFDKALDVILLSAIADTSYLLSYLKTQTRAIHHLEYEDHHEFTEEDMDHLIKVYTHREVDKKVVLTTEKDAMRLEPYMQKLMDANIPVYILPLRVEFLFNEQARFDELIRKYLLNFSV